MLAAPAQAHTPYGQWVVYRQKHLLIGAHRGDAKTYQLAQLLVAGLEVELPDARARVARGPRPERIASLMSTGQLSLAVLSADEAADMAEARGRFSTFSPTALHAMVDLVGQYSLFAAPEFRTDHARLVTEALDHAGLGGKPEVDGFAIHGGAAAHWGL